MKRLRRGCTRWTSLGVALVVCAGCGESEPSGSEAAPAQSPQALDSEATAPRVPPPVAPREEREPGSAPIPPLVGAERPATSPLVAILEEPLPLVLDPPDLGLPPATPESPEAGGLGAVRPGEPRAEDLASLDLDALTHRLRETEALGIFTKASLKNQIDDLLGELGRFHDKGKGRLVRLRERYDSLVLKIMSLVQDDEPQLAAEIARSREQIWQLLADPDAFAELGSGGVS